MGIRRRVGRLANRGDRETLSSLASAAILLPCGRRGSDFPGCRGSRRGNMCVLREKAYRDLWLGVTGRSYELAGKPTSEVESASLAAQPPPAAILTCIWHEHRRQVCRRGSWKGHLRQRPKLTRIRFRSSADRGLLIAKRQTSAAIFAQSLRVGRWPSSRITVHHCCHLPHRSPRSRNRSRIAGSCSGCGFGSSGDFWLAGDAGWVSR